MFGVPICYRDVRECNKRGAAHTHGQYHGSVTPTLLADLAGNPELRALALAALDTQLQAEMPLEYHLVDIARHILRIGVTRDAAADIPRPEAEYIVEKAPDGSSQDSWDAERKNYLAETWWPKFERFAMLVVSNRNVHAHRATCCSGTRGKTGCRFCAPWGHDVPKTRCIELTINSTTGSVPPEPIEVRCPICHADGAMTDTTMHQETKACKIAEADNQREIFYTAANPTPRAAVGEDVRILQVDLKRSRLPSLEAVKTALNIYLRDGKSPEAIEGLRRVLLSTITENAKLKDLLDIAELKLVRNRLMELTTDTDVNDGVLNIPLFQIELFLSLLACI